MSTICDQDTLRQMLDVYDELFYYMLDKPLVIWKTESLANRLNVDQLETLHEMLSVYTEIQDYTKCHVISGWINSINSVHMKH